MPWPMEQNYLLFRTPPGGTAIPAGKTVQLTAALPKGVPVANYKTIRVLAGCRYDSAVPVNFDIIEYVVETNELTFRLDTFTLAPDSSFTKTYDVPGRALVVFATAEAGTGISGIDFGIYGFGIRPVDDKPCEPD